MKWKKFLLIGDSNVQYGFSQEGCWVNLMSNFLSRKCDVINRGFAGYNTHYLKEMLPNILSEFEVDSVCGVIVLLGSNDSALRYLNQQELLVKYKENLEFILDYLTAKWGLSKQKIIFVTPPKIDDLKFKSYTTQMGMKQLHFDARVKLFADVCLEFAKSNNLKYLDLNKHMELKQEAYKELLSDGVHFSTAGSEFFFEHLKPLVNDLTKDIRINYPSWEYIDLERLNLNLSQIDY
jgi:lysophospholipase L1-like esterase